MFSVAVVATISLLLLATLLFYQPYGTSSTSALRGSAIQDTHAGTIYLSPEAGTQADEASTVEKPILGITIANNGLTHLRGATLLSISPMGRMRVALTWEGAPFTWIVEINSGTKFLTHEGEKQTRQDIEEGDTLAITGKLTGGGGQPALLADFVREQ